MSDDTKALLEFAERLSAYSDEVVTFDMEKLRAVMRLIHEDDGQSHNSEHDKLNVLNPEVAPSALH